MKNKDKNEGKIEEKSELSDGEKVLEDEDEIKGSIGFFDLFRFATACELVMVFIAVLCSIALSGLLPAFALVMGELLGDLNNPDVKKAAANIRHVAFLNLVIALGCGLCAAIRQTLLSYVSKKSGHRLRLTYLKSVLGQNIGWYDTQKTESVISRIAADTALFELGIGVKFGELFEFSFTCVVALFVGFYKSWELSLVIMASGPVLAIFGGLFGAFMGDVKAKEASRYSSAGSVVEQACSSIRTVTAFNGQSRELRKYKTALDKAEALGIKAGSAVGCFMGSFNLIIYGMYGLAFWYGAKLVNDGKTNGADVIIVFFCIMFGTMMLGMAGPSIAAITSARGAAYGLYLVIDRKPSVNIYSTEGKKFREEAKSDFERDIEFQNVHFSYPSRPNDPVLHGVSFIIKEGTSLALVGSSGSGKSTCIALMQRFYDVGKGTILFDGHDITTYNVSSLRSKIGLVSQEPILFNTTIQENIGFGRDGVTLDDIKAATAGANIDSFIEDQPDGYRTLVGENGTQLSGGQKQRIAIARALVRDPPILLLDEATSALDTESERIVQEALDKLMEGRTTVMIAHRLSTIKDADQILVFDQGKIIEKGSHTELMEAKEGETFYSKLVKAQEIKKGSEGKDEDDLPAENIELGQRKQTSYAAVRDSLTTRDSQKDAPMSEEDKKLVKAGNKRLMQLIKPEWCLLVFGLFFSILHGLTMPAFALVFTEMLAVFYICLPIPVTNTTKVVYGSLSTGYPVFSVLKDCQDNLLKEAVKYSIFFVGLGVVLFVAFLVNSTCFSVIGERLTTRLRMLSLKAILRQSICYFDKDENSTGIIAAKLSSDTAAIKASVTTAFAIYTQNIFTLSASLAIAFYYGWEMTLVLMVVIPFLILGQILEMKQFIEKDSSDRDVLNEAGKVVFEAVKGIRTVCAFSLENKMVDMYRKIIDPMQDKMKKQTIIQGLGFGYSKGIQFVFYAVGYYFAAYLVEEKIYNPDKVMKTLMALLFGAVGMGQAAALGQDVKAAKRSIPIIFKVIDMIPEDVDVGAIEDEVDNERNSSSKDQASIVFTNVEFRYPSRPKIMVLRDYSLTIPAGKTVALVGTSGSGKSTIIQLIERFYDPEKGSITLDGVNIKDIPVKDLRGQLGLVGQEPVLFDGTIANNIRYPKGGNELSADMDSAEFEAIKSAARNANISEFIEKELDLKYDTNVGSMGSQLSGGQKQRVAIARALFRNPRILLLDEATAALDSKSEQVVQKALDTLMVNRTTVVIAHRLSTIQNADKIVVMRRGKIREMGNHEELLSLNGIYKELCEQQNLS